LVLVNHRGFWDPLLELVDRQIRDGLVHPGYRELLTVVPDAAPALAVLDAAARAPAALVAVDLAKLEGGPAEEGEHG
jgi:predicted Rossmann-fold nucleotide-binding protein